MSDHQMTQIGARAEGLARSYGSIEGFTAADGVAEWRNGQMSNYDFSATEEVKSRIHPCVNTQRNCGHYGAIINTTKWDHIGCGSGIIPEQRRGGNIVISDQQVITVCLYR